MNSDYSAAARSAEEESFVRSRASSESPTPPTTPTAMISSGGKPKSRRCAFTAAAPPSVSRDTTSARMSSTVDASGGEPSSGPVLMFFFFNLHRRVFFVGTPDALEKPLRVVRALRVGLDLVFVRLVRQERLASDAHKQRAFFVCRERGSGEQKPVPGVQAVERAAHGNLSETAACADVFDVFVFFKDVTRGSRRVVDDDVFPLS